MQAQQVAPQPSGLEEPPGPRLLLPEHHDEIVAACKDLEAAMHSDDPDVLQARYRTFEDSVLEHLAAEEEQILPAYATYAPADAFKIREQHAQLRRQMAAVGVDLELHSVRSTTLVRLVNTLLDHARHEDEQMYPWAVANLPLHSRRQLFVRLGRSLQRLARRRSLFAPVRHIVNL
jgi:hypothetical protein